jgi:hypothetical protein
MNPTARAALLDAHASYAEALKRQTSLRVNIRTPIYKELAAVVVAALPPKKRKGVLDTEGYFTLEGFAKARKAFDAAAWDTFLAPFKVRAAEEAARIDRATTEAKAALEAASVVEALSTGQEHPERFLTSSSESTYRSCGSSRYYALAVVALSALGAKSLGVPTRIVETVRNYGSEFEVLVRVEHEADLAVVKEHGYVPKREAIRKFWAWGLQPRVIDPFLPYGYEEQNGLDYFGRDLKAGTGGHEELPEPNEKIVAATQAVR